MITAPKTWRVVLHFLRRYPGLYALSALLQTARLGLTMLPGLIVRPIFDLLAGTITPGWNLWTLCALLVGASLARGAALLWGVFVEANGVALVANALRQQVFGAVQSRPARHSAATAIGDLLSRLSADTRAVGDELRALLLLFGISVSAMIAFAIMLSIAPLLALVACLPLVLATLLFQAARTMLEKLRTQSRAADSSVSAFLGDLFSGVQAIQVAGAEQRVAERLRQLSDTRRRAALAERLFQDVVIIALTRTIAQLGAGLVLLLAGAQLRAGSFSIGDFVLFVVLLDSIADFAFYLGTHSAVYRQAGISLQRLAAVGLTALSASTQADQHKQTLAPLEQLRIEGLTLRYPQGGGIEDISLELERGSLTVITGRVGAGKTTLLRAVLGLIEPQRGAIFWNNQQLDQPALHMRPPHSAYTPQVPRLLSRSLYDNIALGSIVSSAALAEALDCADLQPDLETFPARLETQLGTGGLRLSGGQIQRVALARMLVRTGELLVMDDVSSALDGATERRLWERLDSIRRERGLTILAVSHREELLRRASQVIRLEEGRVVKDSGM